MRSGSSSRRSATRLQHRLRELLPVEASVANPVDMLGSATAASYAQALPVVLDDPQVDAVLVLFVPAVSATAEEVAIAVDAAARAAASGKPVLAVVMSSAGVPQALRAGLGRGGVRISRVGGPRARSRRRARRVAAAAARLCALARADRPCRRGARRRARARAFGGLVARSGRDARAARRLRPAAGARAGRARRRRGGQGRLPSSASRQSSSRPPPARTRPRQAASRSTSRTRQRYGRPPSGSASP